MNDDLGQVARFSFVFKGIQPGVFVNIHEMSTGQELQR